MTQLKSGLDVPCPAREPVRERSAVIWIMVIVGLGVLLNVRGGAVKSTLRDLLAPLQGIGSSVINRMKDSVYGIRHAGAVGEQNNQLSAELVKSRNEVLSLQALRQENLHLREQLAYWERAEWNLVSCEVIGRDVSGWWQTLQVSKGYLDAVNSGMAVITSDGLVGKTLESTPRTSHVLLVSDPSCRVSVRVARTGTFGILFGEGPPLGGQVICRIDFINKNAAIRAGDEVLTSGLGGVFPKGLLVGTIESVEMDPSGLSQRARVAVKAGVGGLIHVFVVVREQDAVDELLQQRSREERARP